LKFIKRIKKSLINKCPKNRTFFELKVFVKEPNNEIFVLKITFFKYFFNVLITQTSRLTYYMCF